MIFSRLIIFIFLVTSGTPEVLSQEEINFSELELLEEDDLEDIDVNELGKDLEQRPELEISEREELDELEELRSDVGLEIKNELSDTLEIDLDEKSGEDKKVSEESEKEKIEIYDITEEEKKLISQIDMIKEKISESDWNSLLAKSTKEKYTVVEGDYLWRIAQKLFGSGFYYAKIWSLNPQITNPHEIEPGMILVFETGDENLVPTVKVGEFKEYGNYKNRNKKNKAVDLAEFGNSTTPKWLTERERLKAEGSYFQFLSDETYADFDNMAKLKLNSEFRKYDPPSVEILVPPERDEYDEVGFDKNAKIIFDYKEGFYLNTFISTNLVQDFGFVHSMQTEPSLIRPYDVIYLKFDDSVDVRAGDSYSIYRAEGKVDHKNSDRSGFRYTIISQVKAIRKLKDLWECEVV